ncbi:MAG: photosystem II biosynthesis protein, partial [Pyrinomonadaceae bacterium]
MGIPDAVSRRMVSRMAVCSGIPTLLGFVTFPLCYVIVQQQWLELPNVAVVVMSLTLFGLGAVGLSYGVLSASWEEE